MAKNYYQDGTTMDWTNGTGKAVLSGQPVIVGSVVGVALGNIPADGEGVLKMTGVFVLPKVADETWPRGAALYMTPDGLLTAKADDGANPAVAHARAGTAWITNDAGDEESRVRLGF